mmetsp:Transcript_76152/g.174446  ORF Transcript_76152/g.174446 Transcript_76152/m.174446 type:complete len:229 (+) Transcript_76152:508-1194(+)
MHLHSLLPLPAGLLHVQLGLLRDIQGHVLLRGRARVCLGVLQGSGALEDPHTHSPAGEGDHQRALLAPELAVEHPHHRVRRGEDVQQLLPVVHPDIPVLEGNQQGLKALRARAGHCRHAGNGMGQKHSVVLLPLEMVAVHHIVHAPHVDILVHPNQPHGHGLQLDHIVQNAPVFDGVNLSVPTGHGNAVLHAVQPHNGEENGLRVEVHLLDDTGAGGVQKINILAFRA